MDDNLFCFNGIDATTGEYLLPPTHPDALARRARHERWARETFDELRWRQERQHGGEFAIEPGRDPNSLAEAGWGLILPAATDKKLVDGILEALAPLRDLRKEEAGPLYKEFVGAAGYFPGESKNAFLGRAKIDDNDRVGPGPVDPTRVPYYLLLVGDPESIPFQFQYELDVAYAVGRIYFRTLAEYASYAAGVRAAETRKVVRARRATFFNVANPGDRATDLSSRQLIPPLVKEMSAGANWQVNEVSPADALKARLLELLGGADTPALLFTASHGVGFPNGDPQQLRFQGSLLCRDWPGPRSGPLHRAHYLGAEDITNDAAPAGLIAFFFACYGAGTPQWDDFANPAVATRAPIAPRAFQSALPTRLLGHPQGGALAVVGHVERAWGCSIEWGPGIDQTGSFRAALRELKDGQRLGFALEGLNGRYAEISVILSNLLEQARYKPIGPLELANRWIENNDARGYAVMGDPAVRLSAPADGKAVRQKIEVQIRPAPPVPLPEVLAPIAPTPAAAPAPPTPPTSPGPVTWAAPDAGAFGGIREKLTGAVQKFGEQLTAFLSDITSLEVVTFVSDDVDQVRYDSATGRFGGARQRAVTRIALDGDTQACVPTAAGQLDKVLWEIHLETVKAAQAHRAAMLKVVADVLSGWIGPGKPG